MGKQQRLFLQLEEQRSKFLDVYSRLTPLQLRFKPEPESWNLLQVLRHIVTAEKQSIIYIQRRIERNKKLTKAGLGSTLRYLILKIAMILPIKFKAPKIAEVREENQDLDLMKEEWVSIRTELKQILDETDENILASTVYKHPRAGLLNMNQALGFMKDHIEHHLKQVNRIQNHPSFPSSEHPGTSV